MMSDDDKELPWLEPAVEDPAENGFLEHYRMAIIAAGIFVIVAFALIIWQVYSGGGVQPGGEVPLVKAEEGPEKVKPDEPGGMEIPDRDKLIYGRVAGQQDDSEAQHLRPGPEVPMDKPKPDAAPVAAAPAPQGALPQMQVSQVQVPKAQAPQAEAPAAEAPAQKPVPAPLPAAPHKTVVEVPHPLVKTAENLSLPAAVATNGDYLIQLGAFSDRAKALAAWQQIKMKFPGVLSKLQPDVITVDRGGKGVLYRLQAGKLAGRANADELCATLKAKAQPCMVVHR